MGKKFDRAQRARSYQFYIDEMIAEERQKEKTQMGTYFLNAKIRVTHAATGVNCEFDLGAETSIDEVKNAIAELTNNGFIRTTSATAANKADNSGKTGRVTEVTKKADKNQWEVIVTLDEVGGGQQKLITFAATAFRIRDRVRLSRNDKGFYEATIINDEGPNGEHQADIPF